MKQTFYIKIVGGLDFHKKGNACIYVYFQVCQAGLFPGLCCWSVTQLQHSLGLVSAIFFIQSGTTGRLGPWDSWLNIAVWWKTIHNVQKYQGSLDWVPVSFKQVFTQLVLDIWKFENACLMPHVSGVRCHVSQHLSHVTSNQRKQPQPWTLPLLTPSLCTVGQQGSSGHLIRNNFKSFLSQNCKF